MSSVLRKLIKHTQRKCFCFFIIIINFIKIIKMMESSRFARVVQLFFIISLLGLGRSFALTPLTLLLGYYFEKRRSLAFGLAAAGFSLGGFLITPLVELMFQNYGFTGHLLC